MPHLIILDALNDVPASLRVATEKASVYLLSFNPDEQIVDRVLELSRQQGIEAQYIAAAGKLDSVALQAREKFSKLVAEVPATFKIDGKNLKEAFTFEDRLSLWWLNDLSSKRSDAYPTFTRICQLEVIREVAGSTGARTIDLISQDCDFWDVVAAYCQREGLKLISERPQGRYRSTLRRSLGILWILSTSISWFLRTAFQTLLAKLLVRYDSIPRPSSGERPCAFYTHYPGMWRGPGGKRDEKYAGVPEFVEKKYGIPSVYACTFVSDGFHQSASIWQFHTYFQRLRAERQTTSDPQVYLLDSDLTWRDFWQATANLSIIWKYALLEINPDFQRQWIYEGINIYPLIRREFRMAMRRIPRYLLHAMKIRNFIEKVDPSCFVTHLFEFCYGRAMIYGVKSARKSVPIIGVQHGPCAKRKLMYYHYPGEIQPSPETPDDFVRNMPIPDHVILEGHGARECLAEAGYPLDRLLVGGAPRLGQLMEVPRNDLTTSRSTSSSRTVLVVFGQHDGLTILSLCLPVMVSRSDCHFILKLHPRSWLSAEKLDLRLGNENIASSYEVASGNIYELMPDADVVIATYSSVGMEAVALGYPVICLHIPDQVAQSPLLDLDDTESLVFWAADSIQLESALDRAFSMVEFDNASSCHIEHYFFDKLDGDADVRWARIIGDVLSRQR